MNTLLYKRILQSQLAAALPMFEDCIRICSEKKWNGIIGTYPFWQVAYPTSYCADLYTATAEGKWKLHPVLHPSGLADIQEEYHLSNV
jgi:hypothetical protein